MNTAASRESWLRYGIRCDLGRRIICLGAGKGAIDHVLKHGYERINLRRTLNISKALLPAVRCEQFCSQRSLRTFHQGVTQPDDDGNVIGHEIYQVD